MICDERVFEKRKPAELGGYRKMKVSEDALDDCHSDAWAVLLECASAPCGMLVVEGDKTIFYSGKYSWEFELPLDFDKWFKNQRVTLASAINGQFQYRVVKTDDATYEDADLLHITYVHDLVRLEEEGVEIDDTNMGASAKGVSIIVSDEVPELMVKTGMPFETIGRNDFRDCLKKSFLKKLDSFLT